MSCYIVEQILTNALVNYAVKNEMINEFTAGGFGQMLVNCNYRSYNARYKSDDEFEEYKYIKTAKSYSTVQILKACRNWYYQSCECEESDKRNIAAFNFYESIINSCLLKLGFPVSMKVNDYEDIKGYEAAEWGIRESTPFELSEDEKKDEQIKKDEAAAMALAKMLSDYSYLTSTIDSKKSDWALGAANIKKELNKLYPETKFSTSSESYSGGCSIRINWTNGPDCSEVDKIVYKYQYGRFDGMTDCASTESAAFDKMYGGAKYVFTSREIKKEFCPDYSI